MCHKVKISTYFAHLFYFKSYCENKIKALVVLLLPDEQSESVKQTATEISTRLSQEKVHSWINKHITVRKYNNTGHCKERDTCINHSIFSLYIQSLTRSSKQILLCCEERGPNNFVLVHIQYMYLV